MKKLVAESIEELFNNDNSLNEGKISNWLNKTKGLISGVFKKIGNFFVALYKDKPIPAIAPVNIGILYKSGKLPGAVNFIPADKDISIESSLSSLKSPKRILDRVEKQYLHSAALNRQRGKLKKWNTISENSYIAKTIKNSINEEKVGLGYKGAHKDDKIDDVGTSFLIKILTIQVRNPKLQPPLIWGAPGIGKTSITKAVIEVLGPGHRLIDVQTSKMSPDDWTLPAISTMIDGKTKEAIDIPKNWLPVYEPSDDPEENDRRNDVANWGDGGIIFLDELSRANEQVQNTCLKLVLERIIGEKRLGSKWAIVAASNREEDDPEGGQTSLGLALSNRFSHYNFVPTVDEWIDWAKGNDIDERITTFVDFNREHFYLFDNEVKVNTSPRSWDALSKMLAACKEYGDIVFTRKDMETILRGHIHSATVEAFAAFLYLLESFTPKQIMLIFSDPDKAPLPKKQGTGYDVPQARALVGAACSQTKGRILTAQELENYVTYFVKLDMASLAAQALLLIIETHPYIHKEVGKVKGKDKYEPAMNIFRKAYGGVKFGDREAIMAG